MINNKRLILDRIVILYVSVTFHTIFHHTWQLALVIASQSYLSLVIKKFAWPNYSMELSRKV